MVLKQKGKPEKGKKPLRGGPRQFTDQREFPDGPIEEFEDLRVKESDSSEDESGSESSELEEPIKKPSVTNARAAGNSSAGSGSAGGGNVNTGNSANTAKPKPSAAPATAPATASSSAASSGPKEVSRRDREAMQKEQARQHYMKMKEKEDGARLALVRKQREEAAAKHAEELRAKEAAKRR